MSRLSYTHQRYLTRLPSCETKYDLDRQSLLQLKESAAQWVRALEAKLEECAALIAQVDYTVAHPNY